jgi:hypothetical protein
MRFVRIERCELHSRTHLSFQITENLYVQCFSEYKCYGAISATPYIHVIKDHIVENTRRNNGLKHKNTEVQELQNCKDQRSFRTTTSMRRKQGKSVGNQMMFKFYRTKTFTIKTFRYPCKFQAFGCKLTYTKIGQRLTKHENRDCSFKPRVQ